MPLSLLSLKLSEYLCSPCCVSSVVYHIISCFPSKCLPMKTVLLVSIRVGCLWTKHSQNPPKLLLIHLCPRQKRRIPQSLESQSRHLLLARPPRCGRRHTPLRNQITCPRSQRPARHHHRPNGPRLGRIVEVQALLYQRGSTIPHEGEVCRAA